MGILDTLSWLINRPQQALFQGAQRGADAYGQLNTALQNEGVPEWISNPASIAASLLPMGAGALRGALGVGDRVTGEDLTRDFTGSPEWDKAIGNQINVTADPLALIPASATGKATDQLAGTAARTWKNIKATQALQPETIANMDRRLGNSLAKYGMDIPYAPVDAVESLPVRLQGDTAALKQRMGYKSSSGQASPGKGFSPNDNNFFAYSMETPQETVPHELLHSYIKQMPEAAQQSLGQTFSSFDNKFPGYMSSIRRSPSYANLPAEKVGEEAFARTREKVLAHPEYSDDPYLKEALRGALDQIRPEMYQNATPYGVSTVPYLGSTATNLWDGLRSGQ